MDTEIEINFAKLCEAFNHRPDLSVFLSREINRFSGNPIKIVRTWKASVVGSAFCKVSVNVDFGAALAELQEKVAQYIPACPICGGRMDGACKHTHGE